MVAAITMVLGMSGLTAFAAGETDGSITIKQTVSNEVYKVYKVFDAVPAKADDTQSETKQIAYTYTKNGQTDAFLTALQQNDSPFTLTEINSSDTYTVTIKDGKSANDVVTFLNGQVTNLGTPVNGDNGTTAEASAPNSQVGKDITIDKLSYGYYYITTTTGSAVTINSAAKHVDVDEKNTVPKVDKKQSTTAGNYADDKLNVNIGDTVYYQTTVTAGKTNDKEITLTDTMSAGLTLDHTSDAVTDLSVKNNSVDVPNTDYTVLSITDRGFKITFNAEYVKTLKENDAIVVTYSAKVNSNAVIDKIDNNDMDNNQVKLEYSNQTTTDTVYISTYDAKITKHDGTEDGAFVPGAGFRLYDAQNGGQEIKFTKEDDGKYYVDNNKTGAGDEIMVVENGTIIRGLKPGTYYLEETTTPAGYNTLTERKAVTITANQIAATEAKVVNNKGTSLPSTGGIGTTIFYILGAILVLGAGVVLVTRRKLSK